MIIKNLTPNQLGSVETLLTTMQDSNPTLTWDNFPMESKPHPIHHQPMTTDEAYTSSEVIIARLKQLNDKVDTILARLDFIFGDHVVMQGEFVNFKNMHNG